MTEFYIVRHAEVLGNGNGQGHSLTLKGRKQRQQLAFLETIPFAQLYSSPAKYCQQTIKPLMKRLGQEAVIAPALGERVITTARLEHVEQALAYLWQNPTKELPGGEANVIAQRRVISWFNEIANEFPTAAILVSTHGELLSLVLNFFDVEIGNQFSRELAMPAVVKISLTEDKVDYEILLNDNGR